jgi:hypothetical protein
MNDNDLIPTPGKGVTSSDLFGVELPWLYAYSKEDPPRWLWDKDDMEDFAKAAILAASKECEGIEAEVLRMAAAMEDNARLRDTLLDGQLPVDDWQQRLVIEQKALRGGAALLRRCMEIRVRLQPQPNAKLRDAAPTQPPQERLSND